MAGSRRDRNRVELNRLGTSRVIALCDPSLNAILASAQTGHNQDVAVRRGGGCMGVIARMGATGASAHNGALSGGGRRKNGSRLGLRFLDELDPVPTLWKRPLG